MINNVVITESGFSNTKLAFAEYRS